MQNGNCINEITLGTQFNKVSIWPSYSNSLKQLNERSKKGILSK